MKPSQLAEMATYWYAMHILMDLLSLGLLAGWSRRIVQTAQVPIASAGGLTEARSRRHDDEVVDELKRYC